MSRRRYVSTDVSIDKRLNRLATEHGDFAALLYSWMIPHATDEATLNGDLDEFMATVIPMRRDKSPAEVQAAIEAMVAVGLLTAWDGETIYFPTEAFYRYQTYIKVENRRIGDVSMGESASPTNADEQREPPKNAVSLSLSPSVSSPLPLSVSGAPPNGAGKRTKPAAVLKPLTAEQRERICQEFADIPDLQDEIDFALQHTAHSKATDDNLYLRHWLRQTRANLQARRNGNGTHRESDPQNDPELQRYRALGIIHE